ncbi:uncharacterized protein LOC127138023 [Lathyrus oleraceus]|uniref:uncharacterized protein LOC127138023 n=1 Tax=Pisum sativum TaxID=3888 RepID=UPI0021D3939E|nr:uncharacterized protein LOC127138023 [Pisum sativum]
MSCILRRLLAYMIVGQTERTIQYLEDLLRAYVLEQGGNWDSYLSFVEFTYNNNFHSSIGMTLFEALYGRRCKTSLLTGVGCVLKSKKPTSCFIGPFHILQKLMKYIHDTSHVIQLDDVQVRENLTTETLSLRIEDREVKHLRGKEITLVNMVRGGPAGGSVTWELESKMKKSYPKIFPLGNFRGKKFIK